MRQEGGNNEITLGVDGNDNSFFVDQRGDGAINRGQISQDGSFNDINLVQKSTGLTSGLANYANVTQIGETNSANVDQTAFALNSNFFSNEVLISQTGDGNVASISQSGSNNKSVQEQTGDNNISNIIQNGDNNNIIHRQTGNGLSFSNQLGSITIEQSGGDSIIIEQYSLGLGPLGD